jgi:pimeloyl-ACP methyl ester carboxylesterase
MPRFIILVAVLFMSSPSLAHSKEYVVILHGIFRTSAHMQPLADSLEKEGYEVLNMDYPSTKYPLAELIDMTAKDIDSRITDKDRTVNFIGYSMGGLLVRGIIAKHTPEHLGRVILLGTPNHGSEVADLLKNNWFYKTLYGPAGQQLGLKESIELQSLFGEVDYELGIIAGNFTIDPFCSYFISGDNDGKVSVESTKLNGMKDHIVVSASHTFFPSNKDVQEQVLIFLRDGRFGK